MAPFDAELYLRLLGERELIGRRLNGHGSDLVEAARALIAVGIMDRDLAAEVIDGYTLAAGLREERGLWRRKHIAMSAQAAAPPEAPASATRVVVCNTKLERPNEEIQIRTVTLSETETKFSLTVLETAGTPGGRAGRVRRGAASVGSMFNYAVIDDRGCRATTAVFNGGGSGRDWKGRLTTDKPLAVDTAWIEFDGTRVELVDVANPCTIGVEPVPGNDPAHHYLWFWLASSERHSNGGADVVIDALIAAGAISPEDPQVDVLREFGAGGWRHRGRTATALPTGLASAPPEWRSLLQSRQVRPGIGTVPFFAVTPPFDGFSLTLSELDADDSGFGLEFDISPGIMHGPFNSLDDRRIAWWAVDDLGQHYLGETGSSGGGRGNTSGNLQFQPAIDRRAKLLTLLPTGYVERARIEVPLSWSTK
jgi:hypothetical protein